MGWGIALKTELYINKISKERHSLEDALEECRLTIKDDREKLLSLAMSTPREIIQNGGFEGSTDSIPWIEYTKVEFDESMKSLRENIELEFKLKIFLENIEKIEEDY